MLDFSSDKESADEAAEAGAGEERSRLEEDVKA